LASQRRNSLYDSIGNLSLVKSLLLFFAIDYFSLVLKDSAATTPSRVKYPSSMSAYLALSTVDAIDSAVIWDRNHETIELSPPFSLVALAKEAGGSAALIALADP